VVLGTKLARGIAGGPGWSVLFTADGRPVWQRGMVTDTLQVRAFTVVLMIVSLHSAGK
jgi:hypothetical protein